MSLQEAMLIVRFFIITTCALLMCYERMVKSHIAGPKTEKYLTIRTLGPPNAGVANVARSIV